MSLFKFGMQLASLSAAYGLYKVGRVAGTTVTLELPDPSTLKVVSPTTAASDTKVSLLAADHTEEPPESCLVETNATITFHGHRQCANFNQDRRAVVIENCQLRVGRLAVGRRSQTGPPDSGRATAAPCDRARNGSRRVDAHRDYPCRRCRSTSPSSSDSGGSCASAASAERDRSRGCSRCVKAPAGARRPCRCSCAAETRFHAPTRLCRACPTADTRRPPAIRRRTGSAFLPERSACACGPP